MGLWFTITWVVTILNILLLAGLAYVWGRNYVELHSKLTIGLLVFALLMLGENLLELYFYMMDPMLSGWFFKLPAFHHIAFMSLTLFQFGALVFLSWVTWD